MSLRHPVISAPAGSVTNVFVHVCVHLYKNIHIQQDREYEQTNIYVCHPYRLKNLSYFRDHRLKL